MKRLRPSASMLVAVLALVIAVAGSALAGPTATQSKKKHADAKQDRKLVKSMLKGATVKHAKSADSAASAGNSANLGGLPPSAYQGRVRWALVDTSGTIVAQSGGITNDHPLAGDNYLDFGSSVAGHPISTTMHYNNVGFTTAAPCGGTAIPGDVSCAQPGTNDTNHVFVVTEGVNGVAANRSFYVVVNAP